MGLFRRKKDKKKKKTDDLNAKSPETLAVTDDASEAETAPMPSESLEPEDSAEPEAAADAGAPEDEVEVSSEERASGKKKKKAKANKEKKGLFSRLKGGLSKTRQILNTDLDNLLPVGRKLDDDLLDEIEELLITSDMGVQTTMAILEKLRKKASKIKTSEDLKSALKAEVRALIGDAAEPVAESAQTPHVIMVIGVNGVGKTTTIGKIANHYTQAGKEVLVVAGDTFRAAAVEQLTIWADRANAEIVRHRENADPAAVAFDGVSAAKARGKDVVIIDTAGRLHTKVNLMEELKKIRRSIQKNMSDAPHETLLVLDATTGQNALSQAATFNEAMPITGLALTKLDGTAKGGVVVSICSSLDVPLKYIGVGEAMADLQLFDPDQFVAALFD